MVLPAYSGWFFSNQYLQHFGLLAPDKFDYNLNKPPDSIVFPLFILGLGIFGSLIILVIELSHLLHSKKNDSFGLGKFVLPLKKPIFTVLILILLAFHIRILVFERVVVAGESMKPLFEDGQTLWLEKVTTGINLPPLSFPFGNIFTTGKYPPFGWKLPGRGSIIVFHYPVLNSGYFIKRLIALPGDHYQIKNGAVYINGNILPENYLPSGTITKPLSDIYQPPVAEIPDELFLLDNAVRYSAMNGCHSSGVVPAHSIFVLGDNRHNSRDSRAIGFIPSFYLIGVVLGN